MQSHAAPWPSLAQITSQEPLLEAKYFDNLWNRNLDIKGKNVLAIEMVIKGKW